jgi:toxin CptA
MPNSPRSYSASVPCHPPAEFDAGRFDWRASRWLVGILVLLGVGAAISLLASDLPPRLAWPSAAGALAWGLWLAWRESRQVTLGVLVAEDGTVHVDGALVRDFRVEWRGRLAFARWTGMAGRTQRRVWWPDTLPPERARELRLALPVETPPRAPRSMAP